jgi:hypothetical protein
MRKLVCLSLQNNEAQRVESLWRPNRHRTDDPGGAGGGVAHAGAGACSCRDRPRAGQTGTQWGTLAIDPGNAAVMAPGDGSGTGFRPAQPGRETDKLEI